MGYINTSHSCFTDITLEPYSLVPEGFVVSWYDDFNGDDINNTNWVVGRYKNQFDFSAIRQVVLKVLLTSKSRLRYSIDHSVY